MNVLVTGAGGRIGRAPAHAVELDAAPPAGMAARIADACAAALDAQSGRLPPATHGR